MHKPNGAPASSPSKGSPLQRDLHRVTASRSPRSPVPRSSAPNSPTPKNSPVLSPTANKSGLLSAVHQPILNANRDLARSLSINDPTRYQCLPSLNPLHQTTVFATTLCGIAGTDYQELPNYAATTRYIIKDDMTDSMIMATVGSLFTSAQPSHAQLTQRVNETCQTALTMMETVTDPMDFTRQQIFKIASACIERDIKLASCAAFRVYRCNDERYFLTGFSVGNQIIALIDPKTFQTSSIIPPRNKKQADGLAATAQPDLTIYDWCIVHCEVPQGHILLTLSPGVYESLCTSIECEIDVAKKDDKGSDNHFLEWQFNQRLIASILAGLLPDAPVEQYVRRLTEYVFKIKEQRRVALLKKLPELLAQDQPAGLSFAQVPGADDIAISAARISTEAYQAALECDFKTRAQMLLTGVQRKLVEFCINTIITMQEFDEVCAELEKADALYTKLTLGLCRIPVGDCYQAFARLFFNAVKSNHSDEIDKIIHKLLSAADSIYQQINYRSGCLQVAKTYVELANLYVSIFEKQLVGVHFSAEHQAFFSRICQALEYAESIINRIEADKAPADRIHTFELANTYFSFGEKFLQRFIDTKAMEYYSSIHTLLYKCDDLTRALNYIAMRAKLAHLLQNKLPLLFDFFRATHDINAHHAIDTLLYFSAATFFDINDIENYKNIMALQLQFAKISYTAYVAEGLIDWWRYADASLRAMLLYRVETKRFPDRVIASQKIWCTVEDQIAQMYYELATIHCRFYRQKKTDEYSEATKLALERCQDIFKKRNCHLSQIKVQFIYGDLGMAMQANEFNSEKKENGKDHRLSKINAAFVIVQLWEEYVSSPQVNLYLENRLLLVNLVRFLIETSELLALFVEKFYQPAEMQRLPALVKANLDMASNGVIRTILQNCLQFISQPDFLTRSNGKADLEKVAQLIADIQKTLKADFIKVHEPSMTQIQDKLRRLASAGDNAVASPKQ